jgi:hypothetical protein
METFCPRTSSPTMGSMAERWRARVTGERMAYWNSSPAWSPLAPAATPCLGSMALRSISGAAPAIGAAILDRCGAPIIPPIPPPLPPIIPGIPIIPSGAGGAAGASSGASSIAWP